MFKQYDPNLQPPKNGKLIPARVVLTKHLKKGMEANLYNGSIAAGGDSTVTITIRELNLSISALEDDIKKAL